MEEGWSWGFATFGRFAFHGDGHENTKMTSNTNPLALNRSLCKPSGCIDAQGGRGRGGEKHELSYFAIFRGKNIGNFLGVTRYC